MREFTDPDVAALVDLAVLVDEIALCIADLGAGAASQAPKSALPLGADGFFLSIAGVVPRLGLAAAKWASYSPAAPGASGLSTSVITVSAVSTGEPLAIVTGMRATHLRTGATAAAVARRWFPGGVDALVLIGFGPTNRAVLEVLEAIGFAIGELRIVVRSSSSARAVQELHPTARVSRDARSASTGAALAISATGSTGPVGDAGLLEPGGAVITLDGLRTWAGYVPADVVDDRGTAGVRPLADAMTSGPVGRKSVVFDIAGSAVADVALAAQLMERADAE
ncbi:hypothetical protein [Naasia lichenicola]|uniref:Ornithine cyclodeaminase family protein n=1 Tax=Naasia lichenicola TaxID=2565933 RepID=A0A4S4FHQ2_9MICO|nr:hypothetical protein [Naasia lichenicola]THG29342.1 hypothetical protein E6C64_11525 [Naasia lichenicola]